MKDKSILLGVTGGIAAYKSAVLCRQFIRAGARVQVVMSEAACEFISPLTLETLSGQPALVQMFNRNRSGVPHIEVADAADLFVIAPATADFLARTAVGRASDLISAVTLAYRGPVLAAPAMNTNMWEHPATRRNLETLRTTCDWRFVAPGSGDLACGWTGPGRMAEPIEIFEAAEAMLEGDLCGRTVLVTAGPTVEDIDPVRFISNRSSGRMGYAIANMAAQRGATVVLVTGPTALSPPQVSELVQVRSALEMRAAVMDRVKDCDAVIMVAAVADYRPEKMSEHKLKKGPGEKERAIKLVRNPDILEELSKLPNTKQQPVRVGFALETEHLATAAREKLKMKKAHIIVANLATSGFGGTDTEALIIDDAGREEPTGSLSKTSLANRLLDLLIARDWQAD
ncbi:MAG: bifunctional phosphopantothenoylcysteine decarboxylase/phosphopantothenate--cysteine ligase CoaBC [Myxococcota bacterium]|nr:bifunctional phosphopantothenoylcysteine decarboxylase/phosphopantothenate--cysteine ligase CoaBC [Myxococcota bacterium]